MIIYTNYFIPPQHHACTRGPIIFIRPEYRNDKGLLTHEKVHRRQWLRTLGLLKSVTGGKPGTWETFGSIAS